MIDNYLTEKSLIRSWDVYDVDFTRYQETENGSHVSTLDHFFWNEHLSPSITDAGVLHSPDNSSDHCPIYCVVKLSNIQLEKGKSVSGMEKPSWRKASPDEKQSFQTLLDCKLQELQVPVSIQNCVDVKCMDPSHSVDADDMISNILDAVETSAKESLPSQKKSPSVRKNAVPGWKSEVKPYRDKAFFWSQVWKSAGNPIGTVLHTVMKRSRNIYHYNY